MNKDNENYEPIVAEMAKGGSFIIGGESGEGKRKNVRQINSGSGSSNGGGGSSGGGRLSTGDTQTGNGTA